MRRAALEEAELKEALEEERKRGRLLEAEVQELSQVGARAAHFAPSYRWQEDGTETEKEEAPWAGVRGPGGGQPLGLVCAPEQLKEMRQRKQDGQPGWPSAGLSVSQVPVCCHPGLKVTHAVLSKAALQV